MTDFKKVLLNLSVIGRMTENDKLNTSSPQFVIHQPTTLRSVYRYWYGESRDLCIQNVSACIHSAKKHIEFLMDDEPRVTICDDTPFSAVMQVVVRNNNLNHMMIALEESLNGLEKMEISYRGDAGTVAKLNLLQLDAKNFLHATKASLARWDTAAKRPCHEGCTSTEKIEASKRIKHRGAHSAAHLPADDCVAIDGQKQLEETDDMRLESNY